MVEVSGLGEVVLNVRDMAAALAFYQDLLGLLVISPPTMASPVFLQAGEATAGVPAMIVLVQLASDAAPFQPPRTLHHLAVTVPPGGLETAAQSLRAAGLEVRRGEHPVLAMATIYVFDPDGNEVELIAPMAPVAAS